MLGFVNVGLQLHGKKRRKAFLHFVKQENKNYTVLYFIYL